MRIELQPALQSPLYLAELFGAKIAGAARGHACVSGIATDTREVQPGDLFLALKGEKTDGAAYCAQAIAAGASALLTEYGVALQADGVWHFQCDNVQEALLAAAAKWRALCGARVVAVTGSAGKTTTKEVLACVLGDAPHNAGNYNSTVGMPLSVLSFPKSPWWVCELGINHIGEMEKMVRSLRPNIGVITNVGSAHIGNFGDFQTLFREKLKLCTGMGETDCLVLPLSVKNIAPLASTCRVLCVGEDQGADFRLENIVMDACSVRCDLHGAKAEITNLTWPIPGSIGKSVLGLSAAVGVLCGRSHTEIIQGVKRAASMPLHTRACPAGEMLFLEDCYNASPEACMAALETLRYLSKERARVAVLGDMLELGEYSVLLHRTLGASLVRAEIDYLFTYGALAAQIATGAREVGMPSARIFSFALGEENALAQCLVKRVPYDAAVLFKASRAVHMEWVVEEIRRLL